MKLPRFDTLTETRAAPIAAALFIAALLGAPPALAEGQEASGPVAPRKPGVWSITSENDMFGSGTDRNYSNGVRIEHVSGADNVHPGLKWVAARLPWIDVERTDLRQGFGLSHAIFTPEDITLTDPNPLDRPYAGWLSFSSTVAATDLEKGVHPTPREGRAQRAAGPGGACANQGRTALLTGHVIQVGK